MEREGIAVDVDLLQSLESEVATKGRQAADDDTDPNPL